MGSLAFILLLLKQAVVLEHSHRPRPISPFKTNLSSFFSHGLLRKSVALSLKHWMKRFRWCYLRFIVKPNIVENLTHYQPHAARFYVLLWMWTSVHQLRPLGHICLCGLCYNYHTCNNNYVKYSTHSGVCVRLSIRNGSTAAWSVGTSQLMWMTSSGQAPPLRHQGFCVFVQGIKPTNWSTVAPTGAVLLIASRGCCCFTLWNRIMCSLGFLVYVQLPLLHLLVQKAEPYIFRSAIHINTVTVSLCSGAPEWVHSCQIIFSKHCNSKKRFW